jgi:Putative lumazine-binding
VEVKSPDINNHKAAVLTNTLDYFDGWFDGGDRRIDVEVVDLHGNIASVVVRSPLYRESLHLVRTEDGWKIVNALWHSS